MSEDIPQHHASHQRVREIAQRIAAAPQDQRRALLEQECEGDRVLRSRVEMMLLRQDQQVTMDGPVKSDDAPELPAPQRIGSYAVRRLLGEGGMGVVYLAEQDRPRRTVALKVIRPGLLTPRMLRRFELESETLAKLQHPGIASIFEAATHESAFGPQPYFAMELVEGKSLTLYAFERKLGLKDRLELFRKVCDAVQHAHQKGVVHRDLKPGNILVTAAGEPKVLDFGIARATDNSAPAGATLRTEAGTLVGTLPYMSPEQVHDPSSVDVRSDVYTLGVILFELITGKLPHSLDTQTLPEAVRIISEAEAPSVKAIDRSIPSDVATIVSKAMEKDRTRRYQSASDLSADIGRFLHNEPILARPPSRAYRVRKFVRRNRALVAGVSLAFIALVAGVIGTAWQAAEATRGRQLAEQRGQELELQKQIAEREAATAKATNEFLTGMLAAASPESESSGELTVREVLDLAAARLASTQVTPRVEIPLRSTLSNTYRALGRTDDALREAKRCLDLARETMGENSIDELEARRTYAVILAENGESDEAEKLTRTAIAVYEKDPAKFDRELAQARCELGRYLIDRGTAAEGAEELRRGIEGLKKHVDDKDRNLQTAMHNYGAALDAAGKPQEAEKALREALAICEKQFGPDHAATAYELNTLANMLQRAGRNDEAIAIHQRTLAIRQKRLPPGHPSILTSMANLATCYVAVGRYDEAIASLRETIELQKKTLGPSHPKTLSSMNNLAFALEDTGKFDEAQSTMRKVVELQRANGFSDPESWGQLNNLASLLVKLNRPAEADRLYRELFAAAEGKLPPDHIVRAIYRNNFGECLIAEGKFDEAKVELEESDKVIRAFFKPEHPRVKKSQSRVERLAQASQSAAPSTPGTTPK